MSCIALQKGVRLLQRTGLVGLVCLICLLTVRLDYRYRTTSNENVTCDVCVAVPCKLLRASYPVLKYNMSA